MCDSVIYVLRFVLVFKDKNTSVRGVITKQILMILIPGLKSRHFHIEFFELLVLLDRYLLVY